MHNISKEKLKELNRQAVKENQLRDERLRLAEIEKQKKKKKSIAITVAIILILGSWIAYATLSPGRYDDFAKCLTEKGAVMYGEDWCKYTQGQKAMFGNSFKYIDYKVKTGLNIRPIWVINNKTYERVQSFERLSALTGCKF